MFQTGQMCVELSSSTLECEGICLGSWRRDWVCGAPEPRRQEQPLLRVLPPPPLQPLPAPHLQVLRWGQQDPGHIQSHIPLSQNHSCVTAQIRCQLEEKGLNGVSLSPAPVRLSHLQTP